jgi:hypothetical protein
VPAYADAEALREALAPDGDISTATAAGLGDSQLEDAIADAQAEVDARVPAAPFAAGDVPGLVATIVVDIAAYLATLTHRKGNPLPDNHPIALRYARAQLLLAKAERGDLDLTDESGARIGEASVVNPYEGDLFNLEDAGLGIANRVWPPWVR